MKKQIIKITCLLLISPMLFSFCGIYVSKSDGTLKNKASQVILVRDGEQTVVTMYNDFKGDPKDFAMVVPVPVLLERKDIRVVSPAIFQKLNAYSSPRLVEYYDENPCYGRQWEDKESVNEKSIMVTSADSYRIAKKNKSGVTIEAQYLVGEYDILILSAKESSGLKRWLLENGYKIPSKAEEVLEPYIKSNLKFFVAKVNAKQAGKIQKGSFLSPLQISFSSPKFILPIRLGMANGDGDQDLIIYSFTRQGRIESVNYRNVEMPTGNNIPLFVKDNFDRFYGETFAHKWEQEGKNIALLEYAWDVTPVNPVKCDPCVGNPPVDQDIVQAGVWWLNNFNQQNFQQTFFTRLHVRYNRNSFPQDLQFQVTPNQTAFQARYVVTHPAEGDLTCDQGKAYLKELKVKRRKELRNLVYLTGSTIEDYLSNTEPDSDNDVAYQTLLPEVEQERESERTIFPGMALIAVVLVTGAGLMRWKGMI